MLLITGLFALMLFDRALSTIDSCRDVYVNQRIPTSGVYTMQTAEGPVSIFCDFYTDRGYTFISKNDLAKMDSLSKLYTESDHAIVRILYNNNEQHDVSMEQLSEYKYRYPLSFQLSDAIGYKRPVNHGLAPYIYVGFLSADVASLKSQAKPAQQGYRTAGMDFIFHNCDKNPNSYIAFFANPNNLPEDPKYQKCCNKLMIEWVNRAQIIPSFRYMPEQFFYMYEMHLGGCGGYLSTSNTSNITKGAAVGLGFSKLHMNNHPAGTYSSREHRTKINETSLKTLEERYIDLIGHFDNLALQ